MARQDRWYPLGNRVLIDKSQFDDDEYSGANLRGMPATYNVGYRAASPDEVTGLWNEFQGTTRQQRDEMGGKFGGVDPRLLQEGLTWQQAAQLYPDAYKASFNFDPSTNTFGGITSAAHSTASTSLGDVAKAALGVYGGGLLLGSGLAALQGVPMWGAPAGAAAGATGTGAAGGAVTTPLSNANLAPAGTKLGALKADGTLAASIPVKTALATGGAGGVPVTELGRQAGFLDTLRNVGPGQAIANSLGSLATPAAKGATGGLLSSLTGSGLGDLINIGGTLYSAYQGKKQGDAISDAAQQNTNLLREIYEYEKGLRQGDIDYYRNLRDNPQAYYSSDQLMGAQDAFNRGLSRTYGNPDRNPTAANYAVANNLGMYQRALNEAAGRAGLGNAQLVSGLGGLLGGSLADTAAASYLGPAAIAGGLGGLGSLLSTRNPYLTYA